MLRLILAWLAAMALVLVAWPVAADELVKFPAVAMLAQAPEGIEGYLSKPKGQGPFPALILLHSCLGLPSDRKAIGAMLAGWGYVALFVDDFAMRGLKQTCLVDFPGGPADAYGGLAYVAGLPYVDKARIGAVGYSQGGDTALRLAVPRLTRGLARLQGAEFRAVAAYYPPCGNLGRTRLTLPVLILVGADDTVTPARTCAALAEGQTNIRLTVYPGAGHVFDDPVFAGGKEMFGMHLQYDRTAQAAANEALRMFLATELR
jgi:dienelactone hydrolase